MTADVQGGTLKNIRRRWLRYAPTRCASRWMVRRRTPTAAQMVTLRHYDEGRGSRPGTGAGNGRWCGIPPKFELG